MKAILFDLDGTLIDSTESILDGFAHAFKSQNFPQAKKEDICSLIGYPLETMFEKLGVSENISSFISEYKKRYSLISTQKTKMLPDAIKAIKLASSLAPLGIVTTKTAKYSSDILEHFKVAKYFKVIIGRENVNEPKPSKEPILKALDTLKVKPDMRCFMIGDTILDMMAANNANINKIGLLCGYGKEQDLKRYTDNIVKNCFEAVKMLSQKEIILK